MILAMETNEEVRRFLSSVGRKGGKARAKALTPEQRTQIARKGGLAKAARARKSKKG